MSDALTDERVTDEMVKAAARALVAQVDRRALIDAADYEAAARAALEAAYSLLPLDRLESVSGEWPTSSVLLDEAYQALPPGRYFKLQSQWIPMLEDGAA